jgi:hypothetical protein
VTASEGLFSPEGLFDAVDVAEGWEAGFEIELGGLCEEGLFAIVVELEKGCATFDLLIFVNCCSS